MEVCRDLSFRTDGGDADEFLTFKRIYSPEEITDLLDECLFRVESIYGDWDLSPLTDGSPKMILVGEKE